MTTPSTAQSGAVSAIPSVARQRLADQIADILREQMVTGALEPGTAIHERETSQALGVSRTPLREALLILEAEGLVETSPARSPIVANPTLKELTEMLQVQSALEAYAGRSACENASDEDIKAIRELYDTMVETNDGPDTVAFFRTDMAFHEAIVRASGNEELVKTHRQYNTRLWRARYMSSHSRLGRVNTMQEHDDMISFLENRDAEQMAVAMRKHLSNAVINVTKIYTDEASGTESK